MVTEPLDLPVTFCFRCGCPLKQKQIALKFIGQYIRYEERLDGQAAYYLCHECLEAVDSFTSKGVRGAIERQEQMNLI